MNRSWTHKNIARSIQFGSKGVLLWPTSDGAPNGWGEPFDTLPGTVGGPNPNVLLTYTGSTVGIKRGVKRSQAGNCYWRGPQGRVISWQGPWGFQVESPVHYFGVTSYSSSTDTARAARAGAALSSIGYTQTTSYIPINPSNPTGPGTWLIHGSRFSTKIFKTGKLFATAPNKILGAAELNGGIIAILVDQTIRYKKGSADWVTIGTLTDPTVTDPAKTLLPYLGIFSFDADGLHAIAIRSVLCRDNLDPSYATNHIEKVLTRVSVSLDANGNLNTSVSHTATEALALIRTHHSVSTYTPPPPPYTDGGSGSHSSTITYSSEGETVVAAGFYGNTEVVLSAKAYETSRTQSNSSSGYRYSDGGNDRIGLLSVSTTESGSNKVGLYSGEDLLVDLFVSTETASSSSSEQKYRTFTPKLVAGVSTSSDTSSTESSSLLFADVSVSLPELCLVKEVSYSSSERSGSFEWGAEVNTRESNSSSTTSLTNSVINPNVSFPVDQRGPFTTSTVGPMSSIDGNIGFYATGNYETTNTNREYNVVGANSLRSYYLTAGYVDMFPVCYGVVATDSGFWATVHYLYTVHSGTGDLSVVETTTAQLPNGLTPESFLGLTGDNQALGNLPSKGVYLL